MVRVGAGLYMWSLVGVTGLSTPDLSFDLLIPLPTFCATSSSTVFMVPGSRHRPLIEQVGKVTPSSVTGQARGHDGLISSAVMQVDSNGIQSANPRCTANSIPQCYWSE